MYYFISVPVGTMDAFCFSSMRADNLAKTIYKGHRAKVMLWFTAGGSVLTSGLTCIEVGQRSVAKL